MNTQKGTPWILLAGVFLTSFSVLALEITFTRILSAILSYHYVSVTIFMALLGLGGGGIFVYLFKSATMEGERFKSLVLFAGLFSISMPLSVIGIAKVPYVDNILVYALLILVPFFLAGIILAQVFRMFASLSGKNLETLLKGEFL